MLVILEAINGDFDHSRGSEFQFDDFLSIIGAESERYQDDS